MDQTTHDTSTKRPRIILGTSETPAAQGNVSGGSAPVTGTSEVARHGGPPTSFNRPKLILGTSEIPVAKALCGPYGGSITSFNRPRRTSGGSAPLISEIPATGCNVYGASAEEPWPILIGQPTPPICQSFGNNSKVVYVDCPPLTFDPSVYQISDAEKQEIFSNLDKIAKDLGYDVSQLRGENQTPGQASQISDGSTYCIDNDRTTLVILLKEHLKYEEQRFKNQYSYGTSYGSNYMALAGSVEYRYCLTALSGDDFWWMEHSSGIKWLAVYGINEICVVTLSGDVDSRRVHGGLAYTDPKTILSVFRKCVLSELEDLADPFSQRSRQLNQRFDVPFCVASAIPDPDTGDTHDFSKYHAAAFGLIPKAEDNVAAEAIDFVRNSGLLSKVEDSGAAVRLAISAFERMIRKKFEAKEIEVTVLSGRSYGDPNLKDLDISEIGDYLSAIENAQQNTYETVV